MKVVAIYDWVEGRFEFYELEGSLCDLFVGIAELYCKGAYIEFVGVAEEERIRDLLVYDQEVISSRDAAKILRSLRIPFVRVEQGTGARFVDEECVEAWLKIRVKYTDYYLDLIKSGKKDYVLKSMISLISVYINFEEEVVEAEISYANKYKTLTKSDLCKMYSLDELVKEIVKLLESLSTVTE